MHIIGTHAYMGAYIIYIGIYERVSISMRSFICVCPYMHASLVGRVRKVCYTSLYMHASLYACVSRCSLAGYMHASLYTHASLVGLARSPQISPDLIARICHLAPGELRRERCGSPTQRRQRPACRHSHVPVLILQASRNRGDLDLMLTGPMHFCIRAQRGRGMRVRAGTHRGGTMLGLASVD